MAIKDYKTISKITSVGSLSSVTVGGQTFNAYKCTIQDLDLKLLPSIDSGSTYQGAAIIKDPSTGNLGLFLMVAANPSGIASGSLAAREAWLAPWNQSNWNAEYGLSFAAQNVLSAPSVGQIICFGPLTGSNPQNLNNITPVGASGGCVSGTLIDQRAILHSIDTINDYLTQDTFLAANSSAFAPAGSGQFVQGTSNSVTLTPGTWLLNGQIKFGNNSAAVSYTELRGLWSLANGANTSVSPGSLGSILDAGSDDAYLTISTQNEFDLSMPAARVTVTANTEIFLVPYLVAGTAANSRITTRIYAQRIG